MLNSRKKINEFAASLATSTDSKTLNKIIQSNPGISADIAALNQTLNECATPATIPEQVLEAVTTPTVITPSVETPVQITGAVPAVTVEVGPIFPKPTITPGISQIKITPGLNTSVRENLIRELENKNKNFKNRLPKKITKELLNDRKLIDLFDKNYINNFNITLEKNRYLSKTMLSVNSELYRSVLQEYYEGVRPDKNTDFLPDNLRGRTGGYWTLNDLNKKNLIFINQNESSFLKKPLQFLFLAIEDDPTTSAFGRTKQSVVIKAKKNEFLTKKRTFSKSLYKSYVEGGTYAGDTSTKERSTISFIPTINRNETYYDYAHEYLIPLTKKELQQIAVPAKPLISAVECNYNYYARNYENALNESLLTETLASNIYVFMSYIDQKILNSDFRDIVTLNGAINDKLINLINSSEYFDVYSQNVLNLNNSFSNTLKNKFKNLIFPKESLSYLSSEIEQKTFPMNIQLEFSADKTTKFTEILESSKFSNVFLVKLVENIINKKFTNAIFNDYTEVISQEKNSKTDNQKRISTFKTGNKRIIQLETLIQSMLNEQTDISSQFVYFGNYSEDYLKYFNNNFKFYKSLMNIVFFAKIQEFIKTNFRTYQEMVGGALAHSEILAYRIAKYEGDISSDQVDALEPIQNIYFCNSNKLDLIKYIDSQVKYGKQYTYVVYAYNLVLGNKYLYSELDNSLAEDVTTFNVYQEPSPIIVEEKYFVSSKKVFDFPPIFPDVQFIPFKGIDNQVRININSNTGIYKTKPTIIENTDRRAFEENSRNQEVELGEDIIFKADDQPRQFEIYRLDFQPTSYADFNNNLIARINTDISPESAQSSTAASYIDSIFPNTKYYYTIRAIDVHGNISNPTELIELEILNQNGTIFMLKKPVNFAEPKKDVSKNMKRFIEIKPNSLQLAINEQKSGITDAKSADDIKKKLILGKVDQSLWNKTFVMKVTSKSTGKKINFKFKFEYEQVKE